MTTAQFEQVKAFVSTPDDYEHLHGYAVPLNSEGKPIGTYIINNKQTKPINYFINGENICESHYSVIRNIELQKRLKGGLINACLNIQQ